MAHSSRRLATCIESWSSEDELMDPPTVSIASQNPMIKEREDVLKTIDTIQQLAQNGSKVIKFLSECDALIVTDSKAACAREIVEQFRRETLHHHHAGWKPSLPNKHPSTAFHPQPFDRLIYLLDRYTEYCATISLSPWPVHHLKVAIWIKGDVISLKTRVIPLRKTVRCYITTMETVRVKTRHLFSPAYESDQKPLITCPILKELLDVLPISRSSNLDGANADGENKVLGGVDRDTLLKQIRSQSGDSKAQEALSLVQTSRQGTNHIDGLRYGKKKPDPHMHTLSRYITFCRSLSIPTWPIEPIRVALWLRESVLSPASPDYTGFKVSLRTVQVYLSRLEYARVRTEFLFKDQFGELATGSLYRNQAIGDILQSFNPNQAKKLGMMTDAFQMEGSLHLSPVIGKRKISSGLLLDETTKYLDYRNCRPKTSSSRSSLAISYYEDTHDSASDCHTASRSQSPCPSSVSDESSAPAPSERDFSTSPSSAYSRKGSISYILCSPEDSDIFSQYSDKDRALTTEPDSPNTKTSSGPAKWSISPLGIPRNQNCEPRFVIPSFDTFNFALSN